MHVLTRPTRNLNRRWLALAALLLAFVASFHTPDAASAAIRACRTDPVILLSNGEIVQTDATIETDVANVLRVRYTLHLPKGVKVIAVIHTPSWVVDREEVFFVDDQLPYHYVTDTVITTSVSNVRSTAHTRALLRDQSISGISGQHLINRINPLLN
jgi:hypothetical protein